MTEYAVTYGEDTASLIRSWQEHQDSRPTDPADYLVHIDHLRMEMDRWTATDEALRRVIGERLATFALEQAEPRR